MDWLNLHIRLAEALGDPRNLSGSLIADKTTLADTDGLRYSTSYRNRLLNASLRYVFNTYDPVFLVANGIPIVGSETDTLKWFITETNVTIGADTWIGYKRELQYPLMRLLSVTGYTVDESTNPATRTHVNVPIISMNSRRLRFKNNPHWENVQFAIPYETGGSTTKGSIIITNDSADWYWQINYIRDFSQIESDTTIGLPSIFYNHIIMYAVYLNKINSQRFNESAAINQATLQEINYSKQILSGVQQNG